MGIFKSKDQKVREFVAKSYDDCFCKMTLLKLQKMYDVSSDTYKREVHKYSRQCIYNAYLSIAARYADCSRARGFL